MSSTCDVRARRMRSAMIDALIERNRAREARERRSRDATHALASKRAVTSWQSLVGDAPEWIRRVAVA